MKFTHKIFHIEENNDRSKLVNSMNNYLYPYSKVLDTPTIKISNQQDYELFIKDNPSFIPDKNGYSLNNEQGWRYGEIGIWASNWTAWHNFLKSDADYLILMEDDIVSSDCFMETLINYISQLPKNWDIFHAFSPENQFIEHTDRHNFGAKDVCLAYQDWSCLCYVVTREGAQKMIDNSYGFKLPLDWYMFRQQNIFNVYTVKPLSKFPCTLFPTESTFQTTQKREILNGLL